MVLSYFPILFLSRRYLFSIPGIFLSSEDVRQSVHTLFHFQSALLRILLASTSLFQHILLLLPALELLLPLATILTMGDVAIDEINHPSRHTAPHCQDVYLISLLPMCLLIASR
jgi:hypothetical protein